MRRLRPRAQAPESRLLAWKLRPLQSPATNRIQLLAAEIFSYSYDIVTQICYRAADLSYLLRGECKQLADYSEELRRVD